MLILDTGVLVAAADRSDPRHGECAELVAGEAGGQLVGRYNSVPLGGTDVSLIALAERHQQTEIATLDHRHFTVVQPKHIDAFTLLP